MATMTQAEILSDAVRLKAVGASVEQIIFFLRDKGMNKIASINAVRTLYEKPTNDAKVLVDNSDAWSDRFHSDRAFQDNARRALLELASSEDNEIPDTEFKIYFGRD